MSDEKKTQPKIPPILGRRFNLVEQRWNTWQVTVPEGTPFERLLEPDYWAHIPSNQKIQPYEKIEVRIDDFSYFAELMVMDVGKQWLKVRKLTYYKLEAKKGTEIDLGTVLVRFAGPEVKHQVVRKSDKKVLKDGISRKSEAVEWAEQHISAMAS